MGDSGIDSWGALRAHEEAWKKPLEGCQKHSFFEQTFAKQCREYSKSQTDILGRAPVRREEHSIEPLGWVRGSQLLTSAPIAASGHFLIFLSRCHWWTRQLELEWGTEYQPPTSSSFYWESELFPRPFPRSDSWPAQPGLKELDKPSSGPRTVDVTSIVWEEAESACRVYQV